MKIAKLRQGLCLAMGSVFKDVWFNTGVFFLYSRFNKAQLERGGIGSGMNKWNFYFISEFC